MQTTLLGFFKENGKTKPITTPSGNAHKAHLARPTAVSLPKPAPVSKPVEEDPKAFLERKRKEYANRKPNPYPNTTSFMSTGPGMKAQLKDEPIANWNGAWEGRRPPYADSVMSAIEYDDYVQRHYALKGCSIDQVRKIKEYDPDPRMVDTAAKELEKRERR